jgi:hypothetical protein
MAVQWYDVVGGTHDANLAVADYNPDATNLSVGGGSIVVKTSGGTFGTTKHVLETGTTASGQVRVWVDFTGTTSFAWAKELVVSSHTSGTEQYIAVVASSADVRGLAYAITNTGTMRNRDAANAAKWTGVTTSTEQLALNTRYHISTFVTQNASTGTYRTVVYNIDTQTLLVDTTLRTGINTGSAAFGRFSHGFKATTGTNTGAHESAGFAIDTAATDVILPRYMTSETVSAGTDQTGIEPWSTVTLTATASDGSAVWSQLTGTSVTLTGSDPLIRTFVAPPTFTGETLTFRATNGSATDDVAVTVLPATDGIVTGAGPTVVPIRFTRKT